MSFQELHRTAKAMMASKKGILAIDESVGSANAKRLDPIGVEGTEENRRKFRDLFLSAPNIEKYISGVILHEETLLQKNNNGVLFPDHLHKLGIIPGIKVDGGAKDDERFPGEKITAGLSGLAERLDSFYKAGARFAKWRAVITIDTKNNLPTHGAILENAVRLAKYAELCQQAKIVPMVEPEVILDGPHSFIDSERITHNVLHILFDELERRGVDMQGLILKTSMVLPGKQSEEYTNVTHEDIARRTVRVLFDAVPHNIGGVVFLSGGQSAEDATLNLDRIAELEPLPFEVAFSYARAIQTDALNIWKGQDGNVESARQAYMARLQELVTADQGKLD